MESALNAESIWWKSIQNNFSKPSCLRKRFLKVHVWTVVKSADPPSNVHAGKRKWKFHI